MVGRSDDCNLTIPSQRVSRKHAEMIWNPDKSPSLKDLGSQNGTLVNGKRIKGEHKLAHGDEIEFGPFLCTFRSQAEARRERAAAESNESSSGMMPDVTQPMLADAMAGRLDQINLTELLQTLEFNAKTGTLEVFGSDGDGMVVIQEGKPTYGECDGAEGPEAIYKLIHFKNGQFSFKGEVAEDEVNINMPMGSLLMEAARRVDEG